MSLQHSEMARNALGGTGRRKQRKPPLAEWPPAHAGDGGGFRSDTATIRSPRLPVKGQPDCGLYRLANHGPSGPQPKSRSSPLPSASSRGPTNVFTPCTTSAKVAGAPSIWLRLMNLAHIT